MSAMTPEEHLAMAERLLKDASNTTRVDAATRLYRSADAHARIAQAQVGMVTNVLLAEINQTLAFNGDHR